MTKDQKDKLLTRIRLLARDADFDIIRLYDRFAETDSHDPVQSFAEAAALRVRTQAELIRIKTQIKIDALIAEAKL